MFICGLLDTWSELSLRPEAQSLVLILSAGLPHWIVTEKWTSCEMLTSFIGLWLTTCQCTTYDNHYLSASFDQLINRVSLFFFLFVSSYFFCIYKYSWLFGTKFPFLYDSHGLFHGGTIKSTERETDFYLECGLPWRYFYVILIIGWTGLQRFFSVSLSTTNRN